MIRRNCRTRRALAAGSWKMNGTRGALAERAALNATIGEPACDVLLCPPATLVAAMAAQALISGDIDRIIFTRPAVEAGNSMGFLPGKLDEKFDPYFSAFKSCLISNAGKGVVECALKNGNITMEPLAYMRGKTFNRAFVVLDEAQNCTAEEIKMFMTRIGQQSTVVISGDLSQSDIRCYSGLYDAITRTHSVKGVYVHEFEYQDIVRSDIVKDIIMCYDDSEHKMKRYRTEFA